MDPETLKVTVPAIVSIFVALIAMVTSLLNGRKVARSNKELAQLTSRLREEESRKVASSNEELAELTSKLRDEESVRAARRDYEYEARKKLYTMCEPLLFQFFELAEDAESRIRALARDCQRGNLRQDGGGWLASEQSYYYNSTLYRLFAPIAAIRLLQRRLTAVDLALDSQLKIQYRLLRMLYRSITEDQDLAQRSPMLSYDPDRADPEQADRDLLLAQRPETYVRQGLYRGTLDRLVDALIIRDREFERVMSFSEFLQFKQTKESQLYLVIPDVRLLLIGFHPLARPVLWRVLVFQKLIYDALSASRDIDRTRMENIASLVPATGEYLETLDWRQNRSEAHRETVESAVTVARTHIIERSASKTGRMAERSEPMRTSTEPV